MPTTSSGIPYEVLFDYNNRKAYSEQFVRDANSFSVFLGVDWNLTQDFRRDVLGYTEYNATNTKRFARTLPMLCPYTVRAYANSMTLMNYGRRPNSPTVADFDDEVVIFATNTPGVNDKPAFYDDPDFEEWFTTQYAIYQVTFSRQPWLFVEDENLTSPSTAGTELQRYVMRQRATNVQELRVPDFNFKEEGVSPVVPLYVNGFVQSLEAEIVYKWIQIPFGKVPTVAINANRLKINSNTFDTTFEPETMLFVDCKDYELPYEGADGGLYVDPQFIFRQKRNLNSGSSTVLGHQHFLNPAGIWKKAERRNNPGVFLYQTSADFDKLFSPLGA